MRDVELNHDMAQGPGGLYKSQQVEDDVNYSGLVMLLSAHCRFSDSSSTPLFPLTVWGYANAPRFERAVSHEREP